MKMHTVYWQNLSNFVKKSVLTDVQCMYKDGGRSVQKVLNECQHEMNNIKADHMYM